MEMGRAERGRNPVSCSQEFYTAARASTCYTAAHPRGALMQCAPTSSAAHQCKNAAQEGGLRPSPLFSLRVQPPPTVVLLHARLCLQCPLHSGPALHARLHNTNAAELHAVLHAVSHGSFPQLLCSLHARLMLHACFTVVFMLSYMPDTTICLHCMPASSQSHPCQTDSPVVLIEHTTVLHTRLCLQASSACQRPQCICCMPVSCQSHPCQLAVRFSSSLGRTTVLDTRLHGSFPRQALQ